MNNQQRTAEETLDRFAELLSRDIPLRSIAERMGIRSTRASQLLMKLRERLGPQAV
jgi:hypothetical protein